METNQKIAYEMVFGDGWASKFVEQNIKKFGGIIAINTGAHGETNLVLTDDSGMRRSITLSPSVQCAWFKQISRV